MGKFSTGIRVTLMELEKSASYPKHNRPFSTLLTALHIAKCVQLQDLQDVHVERYVHVPTDIINKMWKTIWSESGGEGEGSGQPVASTLKAAIDRVTVLNQNEHSSSAANSTVSSANSQQTIHSFFPLEKGYNPATG